MLNKITTYSLFNRLPLLTLGMVLAFYMADHLASSGTQPHEAIKVRTVSSLAIAGDAIPMTHFIEGQLQVDQSIILQLNFTVAAEQLLELVFLDSALYSIDSAIEAVYEPNRQGKISIEVPIQLLSSGKIYLKFMASTTDGQRVKSFSIPLNIKDVDGQLPVKTPNTKTRVNLPVSSQ